MIRDPFTLPGMKRQSFRDRVLFRKEKGLGRDSLRDFCRLEDLLEIVVFRGKLHERRGGRIIVPFIIEITVTGEEEGEGSVSRRLTAARAATIIEIREDSLIVSLCEVNKSCLFILEDVKNQSTVITKFLG